MTTRRGWEGQRAVVGCAAFKNASRDPASSRASSRAELLAASRPAPRFPLSLSVQVNTEHILLGLVEEESLSKNGYLNSGLSSENARAAVEAMFGRKRPVSNGESIPFSREVRKMFESATLVRSFAGCTALRSYAAAGVTWLRATAPVSGVQALQRELDLAGAHPAGYAGHARLQRSQAPARVGIRTPRKGWRRTSGWGTELCGAACLALGCLLPRLAVDVEGIRGEASKRLKGDTEAEAAKKKQVWG
jgi:hypothetical protein